MTEYNLPEISAALPESLSGQWESLLAETIKNTKKAVICLVGAFSVGKSSLINMLIGRDILPEALKETTTLPTFVEYSPQQNMSLTDANGNTRTVDLQTFQQAIVSRGEPGSFATLSLPEPWLENIVLADLPGTGSKDKSKTDFTRAQIRTSDVIVYMIPLRGPDREDVRLLKEIHTMGKKTAVLAAKWDEAEKIRQEGKEQVPDLQEWEECIEKECGCRVQMIPSARTGIGKEKILEFLQKTGQYLREIREKRFRIAAVPLLKQGAEFLREEKQACESQDFEQKQKIREEIRQKRELLIKLRSEILAAQETARKEMENSIQNLEKEISGQCRAQLKSLKEILLQNPAQENWQTFLDDCNQSAGIAMRDAASGFRQVYEKYGNPPVPDAEFKSLHFQFPRPPVFETDDLLEESQLHFLGERIQALTEEISREKQNTLPVLSENSRKQELLLRIQEMMREKQEIENAAIPMQEEERGGGNMGKFIGRILGEAADIGLMFVQPEVIAPKIASYVGKGAETLRVSVKTTALAKEIMTGIKTAQLVQQGVNQTKEYIRKTPTSHVMEKARILEKFCLGYWGERMGGFFDEAPRKICRPDPAFLEQKNQVLMEKQTQLHRLQADLTYLQQEIRTKELTAYQLKSREKELHRLMQQKERTESSIAAQKEVTRQEAEHQFRKTVENHADNAIRNFINSLEKQIRHMRQILNATFREYWEKETEKTLEEHRNRLTDLEQSLNSVPEDRQKKTEELEKRIRMLKTEADRIGAV